MGRHLLMTTTAWPITGYCWRQTKNKGYSLMLQKYDTAQQNFWTAFDSTSSLFTFLHKQITFTFLHLLINFQIYCSTAPVPDLCKEIDPENPLCHFHFLASANNFHFLTFANRLSNILQRSTSTSHVHRCWPWEPTLSLSLSCISKPLSLSYIC